MSAAVTSTLVTGVPPRPPSNAPARRAATASAGSWELSSLGENSGACPANETHAGDAAGADAWIRDSPSCRLSYHSNHRVKVRTPSVHTLISITLTTIAGPMRWDRADQRGTWQRNQPIDTITPRACIL